MKRPLLARVLREPSYGWVGPRPAPAPSEVRREWLHNLLSTDRRRWMTQYVWALHLGLAALLPVYLLRFATVPGVLAGLIYALLILPCWGTFYLHRYGTHRAFVLRSPLARWLAKHMVIQLVPEELYVISHHVHHRYADRDGDPYDPRGGWWYCLLADANHQALAWDLDEADHARVARLLEHLPVAQHGFAGYRRWGSLAHPGWTVAGFALNHAVWYGLLWAIGGHGLAMGVFSLSSLWLLGIRQFNYRAHGAGQDLRVDGEDLHRGDLSVNRTLSAWLAGEWHNNHHM
jgi:fatty-acid desaturase